MKFVRLGDYVINVSEIRAIKRIGAGCDVYMLDGTDYRIATVSDETYESAIAYICLSNTYGGIKDERNI